MSRTLTDLTDNVANAVQDDSAEFRSVAKVYINKRYKQILRAINWNYINEDYTVTTVSGTQDYNMPSDFGKELYLTNETLNKSLTRLDIESLVRDYVGTINDAGEPLRYCIFRSDDGNTKMRLHPVPNSAYTLQLPYTVKPTALANSTDTTVLDFDDLIEIGATADAWRYKRQFAKAKDLDTQFYAVLQEHIWDEYNQPNRIVQFKPSVYDRDNLV